MKILLTFAGAHDPFAGSAHAPEPGPVLTLVAALPFDCVQLLSTADTKENAAQTRDVLQQQHQNLTVEVCDVPLKDPGDPSGIPKQLKAQFKKFRKQHPKAEYFVGVSSGVPHVDAAWLMLAAGGEIPARILQARAAKFFPRGDSRVAEMDFANPQFPQIKPVGAPPEAGGPYDFQSLSDELCLVGDHSLFLRELKTAFSMAEYDSPILLLGETNTGKEAFARLIHCASKRAAKPFLSVNCAAIPEPLIESRLFGHLQGAFPGAEQDQKGCFEEADGGTLFLDQIESLSAPCQARLVRAMEYGKIRRLGHDQETSVNVRVIAASSVDIENIIAEKAPRKDLYQAFYLLRFSAQTRRKWDRMLQALPSTSPEESQLHAGPVPLPRAANG